MSRDRFYVTTPIYYVNDVPHVGHAYATVVADVLARYHRMLGVPTWFLTGTDEHGQKAQLAAEARGIPPQQLCDEYSAVYREMGRRIGASNDDFIRTTEERHVAVVTRVLERLWEGGHVYKADYEGWYCTRCERFWTDQEVSERGGGRCPDQPELHEVARLTEANYFFRMSAFAERLRAAIESGEMEILPEKRRNEVLGFLRQGLGDLCISRARSRLHWGVPLPFDPDYVTYVWVDALFNYESAIGYLGDAPRDEERHSRWWPADLHVLGKDILTTHAVYWPTLLMAVGEPLPRRILGHGWLLDRGGLKISKTKRAGGGEAQEPTRPQPPPRGLRGQGGPPHRGGLKISNPKRAGGGAAPEPTRPQPTLDGLLEVFGRDVTRWALATATKYGDDAVLDWDVLRERVNAELANGLGNSVNRVLRMVHQFGGGRLAARGPEGPAEAALREAAEAAIRAVRAVPDGLDILAITIAVRAGVDRVSAYLDQEKPWKAAKDAANLPRVGQVLAWCVETLRVLGLALTPVMPEKMDALRRSVGVDGSMDFEREAAFGLLAEGAGVGEPPGLFPRVDDTVLPAAGNAA